MIVITDISYIEVYDDICEIQQLTQSDLTGKVSILKKYQIRIQNLSFWSRVISLFKPSNIYK